MSTTLPHGIIQINEGNIAWYGDITANWQLIDGKIGIYDAAIASIPAPANNGTLTINYGGTTIAMFGADDAGNVTADIPAPGDGTLTVTQGGSTLGSFTANQAAAGTIDIPAPGDGTLTIQQNGTNVQTFTADQSTNATANITVPTKTSDLTNDSGFITSDNTKIPLAGSNAISGSLIPSTDNSIDIGSSTKNIKALYTKGITIDGAQFLPSDYIPRSGGAVITGGNLARTVDNSLLKVSGGTAQNHGGTIAMYGKDISASSLVGTVILQPSLSESSFKNMILYPDGTWTWQGQAVQLISDQRFKQQITEIDDKLLDAWEDVGLVQFKYNDAVKEKSDNARLHTGYVVQQIDKACKSHGVDISQYGLYCHEEYPQETEEVEVEQADGTKVKEKKVIHEASEHYSLRYTEVYAVECMYLRRCIERLTARIEGLEKGKEQEAGK